MSTFTKQELEEYMDVLSDVLCFMRGVKFSQIITESDKLSETIDFINVATLRKLRIALRDDFAKLDRKETKTA
jgi:hypothetical protein